MTLGAAFSRNGRRSCCGSPIERHHDVVNAVAISADRRARHATLDCLPVNTLHELSCFRSMALAAGVWNVGLGNRRLLVRCRFDIVAVMTVGAYGRAHVAARDRFGVNALSIRKKRTVADAAALHYRLITVTAAAGLGDIRSIDCRLRIAGGQDRRHVAIFCMAIKTRRRFDAIVNRLSMKAVIVCVVWRRVKERAGQIWKRLSRPMASLTFQIRRRDRRCSGIWPADNGSFIGPKRCRRRILITLSFR